MIYYVTSRLEEFRNDLYFYIIIWHLDNPEKYDVRENSRKLFRLDC